MSVLVIGDAVLWSALETELVTGRGDSVSVVVQTDAGERLVVPVGVPAGAVILGVVVNRATLAGVNSDAGKGNDAG